MLGGQSLSHFRSVAHLGKHQIESPETLFRGGPVKRLSASPLFLTNGPSLAHAATTLRLFKRWRPTRQSPFTLKNQHGARDVDVIFVQGLAHDSKDETGVLVMENWSQQKQHLSGIIT